jgi:hypothetical protein
MAQSKVHFHENSDFPFKAYITALKALKETPRAYRVSLPVESQSKALKKLTKREAQLEEYLSQYPSYADAPDWDVELEDIQGDIQWEVTEHNHNLNTISHAFFDEIAACGCEVTDPQTPKIAKGENSLNGGKATCEFIGTEVPEFITKNHKVSMVQIQMNKMPAAQRRVLAEGTSVFLKQLGEFLKIDALKKDVFFGKHEDYVEELVSSIHFPRKAEALDKLPTDFRNRGTVENNIIATNKIRKLAQLDIFQNIDIVRAVLIAQSFWGKDNSRAQDFLEALDALVDTGLFPSQEKDFRREPYMPLQKLYDQIRPFDTRDTKRTYYRPVKIEIENENGAHDNYHCESAKLRELKAEHEELSENPDFKLQLKIIAKSIRGQEAIVSDALKQYNEFSAARDDLNKKVTKKKRKEMKTRLKATLQPHEYKGLDLSFSDIGFDHNTHGLAYKIDATIQATPEIMTKVNPDDSVWGFRLKETPAEADGFDAEAFVKFVNDPSRLKTKGRVHGVTDNMLRYFKSRNPLVFSVKHMVNKPK